MSEIFEEIKQLIADTEGDCNKFYANGNNAAGTRVRKNAMALKGLCQKLRVDIQTKKNVKKVKKTVEKDLKSGGSEDKSDEPKESVEEEKPKEVSKSSKKSGKSSKSSKKKKKNAVDKKDLGL